MTAAKKVTVRVVAGWAVYVDGEQVSGPAEVDVDPDTAAHWISRGWAEPV